MARGLFVSDLHAALRLPMARVEPGGVSSDRLQDVISILDQLREYAGATDAAFVAILGDLFDQRHPDGATLVSTSRALGALAREVPTYVLPGNHDAVDRDGRLYSLQFYRELDVPGLHILGHETVYPLDGVALHAVPWLPEERARKRIAARAKNLPKSAANLLLFHQGIRGALWDSGRASTDGLDGDIGEGFDLALTGHYHRPQEFTSGRFLGSPLDLRFGDEAVPDRGFWEVEFGSKVGAPRLIRTEYPRFATVHVRLYEGDELGGGLFAHLGGDVGAGYVRVVVEGPAADVARARPALAAWKLQAPDLGVRVLREDLRPQEERRARLKVDAGISLAELTRRYAVQFAPEGQDGADLADLGVRMLEEG